METVALLGAHFLEVLFFVGMVGSALVVVISFVEDLAVLLQKDKEAEAHHTPQT